MENKKQTGFIRLISRICLNSNYPAFGIHKNSEECCQCGFDCKVRAEIERNGHRPYKYILSVKEYRKLSKELIDVTIVELTENCLSTDDGICNLPVNSCKQCVQP